MKKIGNSIVGVIIGIICLIGGTGLLWWNEGNNVKNIKTTDEISVIPPQYNILSLIDLFSIF